MRTEMKAPEWISIFLGLALVAMILGVVFVSDVENHSLHIVGSPRSIEEELDEAMPPAPEGVFGSGAEDLRAEYAADYRRGRTIKLQEVHYCEACGISDKHLKATEGGHLETHHVKSVKVIFTKKLSTKLIGDPENLIVLCRGKGSRECHFRVGHDGDGINGPNPPRWTDSNIHVREDAARILMANKIILAH